MTGLLLLVSGVRIRLTEDALKRHVKKKRSQDRKKPGPMLNCLIGNVWKVRYVNIGFVIRKTLAEKDADEMEMVMMKKSRRYQNGL